MKKIMLVGLVLLITTHTFALSTTNVEDQLQQSFEKSFPNARNVHWEDNQNGFAVEFVIESVFTRISYDREGKFTGSLRYYSRQLLPFYIAEAIRKEYQGQEIFGVTEVTTPTEIAYYVKLESAKHWTTIRVDSDGTITQIERYRKAE